MKKLIALVIVFGMVFSLAGPQAFAVNTAKHGEISGKSAVHGLASLIIWPGLGQYLNGESTDKNWTHAILGLTGIFRLWSGWDALIDRSGGRWDGKI